jgi:hypothetical protein
MKLSREKIRSMILKEMQMVTDPSTIKNLPPDEGVYYEPGMEEAGDDSWYDLPELHPEDKRYKVIMGMTEYFGMEEAEADKLLSELELLVKTRRAMKKRGRRGGG